MAHSWLLMFMVFGAIGFLLLVISSRRRAVGTTLSLIVVFAACAAVFMLIGFRVSSVRHFGESRSVMRLYEAPERAPLRLHADPAEAPLPPTAEKPMEQTGGELTVKTPDGNVTTKTDGETATSTAAAEVSKTDATVAAEVSKTDAASSETSADVSKTVESSAPSLRAEAEFNRPRPKWVDVPDGRQDNEYHAKVSTSPYAIRREGEAELREEIVRATEAFLDGYLGEGAGEVVDLPMPFIKERIVREEWEEPWNSESVGQMLRLHALLVFDEPTRNEIKLQYEQSLVARRLQYTGGGAGLILGLLATMFGYLKLDTATRGYYSGRLRVAAGAMILSEAAVFVLMVRNALGF